MSSAESPINNQLKTLEGCTLATATIVTLITLVWLLVHSRYGIDLTDESYYLIWIANPWIYPVSTTQFGFIYHPLHLLFHGDISLLRQANILIIFGLTWVLCIVFFKAITTTTYKHPLYWYSLPMLTLAGITATCSLIYFCPFGWLATPSYNSLVFQALLLTSIGLLLADKTVSQVSITGWLLIGIGGWLTFMAKPTSAAALGLVISVCLLLTKKYNYRLFSISLLIAIFLLIVSAWVIDDSLVIFIDRLRKGAEELRLLEAKHSLSEVLRIDNLPLGRKEQFFLVFSSVIIFGVICLAASEKRIRIKMGLGVTLLFAIISLMIISENFVFKDSDLLVTHLTLLVLAVPLGIMAFYLIFIHKLLIRNQWGIALYFAVLPYVAAFGTNNNYWLLGSAYGVFWVLAGLIILISTASQRVLLPVVVSGQLITIFLLSSAMERPYFRQPEPFHQYTDAIIIDSNESQLMLPKDLANFLRNVKKMTTQANFKRDTPVINMSGYTSILYVIGAKVIGEPWIIGGYSGSNNVAQTVLNNVPCTDIAAAWLLIDPDSMMKLSLTILSNLGISFEQNFEMAADLNIPSTSIARYGIPSRRLELWKPTHPTQQIIAACEQKRNSL
jgi:hypothetical protein